MSTTAADLSLPLRAALVAATTITTHLDAYKASYPIFTRRPVPTDAPFPLIAISPDIALTDDDGINDFRPVQSRDVTVYGQNTTAPEYLEVEEVGYAIRDLFHRNRQAITVTDWNVIQIIARGPFPAPADGDNMMARVVSLEIQLARKPS